jgi:ABC-2 type transport system permease protein
MVTIGVIARVELLRLLRDRSNIFFVFVFPLLLVVLIGSAFGGGFDQRIGVVGADDAVGTSLVERLDAVDGITVVAVDGVEALQDRVARGGLGAGLVVPEGLAEAVDAGAGTQVAFVGRPDATSVSLRAVVATAVGEQAGIASAVAVAEELTGQPTETLTEIATGLRGVLPGVTVAAVEVGGDELTEEFAGLGQFDLGASSQLFLFTFLTALTASASLIQTRRLGVAARMVATPNPVWSVLAGQAAGRILVALAQAAYIIIATVLLFRVNWGDPLATGVVVVLFCVVAGAAAMLVGATVRNDSQASGLGVGLGLGMAALGGSMMPLEIYPEVMRRVAYVTPHAWANDAMAEIVRRDGGLGDVLGQVAVLSGFAVSLLALATWRLRRTLTTGAGG